MFGRVAHIYANGFMAANGIEDPRPEALAYLARVAYPGAYDPEAPGSGCWPKTSSCYDHYDRGAEVMGRLASLGAVRMEAPWKAWDGHPFPDYYDFPENAAPRGRGVQALVDGTAAATGVSWSASSWPSPRGRDRDPLLEPVVDLVVGARAGSPASWSTTGGLP